MSLADEIAKLDGLRKSGAMSEEEYEAAKTALLRQQEPVADRFSRAVGGISSDVNMWSMFIHLSQFCGFLVPLAGLVVPIVLWQVKKNESEIIDKHGKNVTNWIITEFILGVVFVLLSFVIIGIPLLFVLGVLGVIFPIVGAVKANNGEVWRYPLSIKFFPVD